MLCGLLLSLSLMAPMLALAAWAEISSRRQRRADEDWWNHTWWGTTDPVLLAQRKREHEERQARLDRDLIRSGAVVGLIDRGWSARDAEIAVYGSHEAAWGRQSDTAGDTPTVRKESDRDA